jgi:hypothetical protein
MASRLVGGVLLLLFQRTVPYAPVSRGIQFRGTDRPASWADPQPCRLTNCGIKLVEEGVTAAGRALLECDLRPRWYDGVKNVLRGTFRRVPLRRLGGYVLGGHIMQIVLQLIFHVMIPLWETFQEVDKIVV